MTEINKAVSLFNDICQRLGGALNPPYRGEINNYHFSRGIEDEQPEFWKQYGEFSRISDGINFDGIMFHSLDKNDKNNIFLNNDILSKEKGFYDESLDGFIVIGSDDTDIFVFNTGNEKWEVRDRIASDYVYDSCDTLSDLIMVKAKELKERHGL
ncbi:YrhA family protein [Serratia rubidaea]|uniref:YrhA family protein n=1 Tax=Serratia rubidaea TaxID=61652 RepID=UPI002DBF14FD|nr:YrhA family protein [Serratia rubidaea]MEB7584303.1 YrhA family protein [Serratia rubidaea]